MFNFKKRKNKKDYFNVRGIKNIPKGTKPKFIPGPLKTSIKENLDIKELNIPNVCFSICPDDTENGKIYRKQRIKRGFDDSETWSFDCTIAKFALPRLKRFKEVNNGSPRDMTEEEWNNIIDEMIYSFEFISKDICGNDLELNKVNKGLKLFSKYLMYLWW
jgi:hypothetical protein